MNDVVVILRVVAGIAALCYAAYLIAQRVKWPTASGVSDADLRAVLDLASRFRAAGRTEAVHLCQQLLDELLKAPGQETPR